MKLKEIPVSLFHQLRLSLIFKKISTSRKEQVPVIVSLASIPSRLHIVHITILSILNQNVLPKKLILWLHEDLKNQIPKNLRDLTGSIFVIKYSNYGSSHRKLVETLKLFINTVIVTCDDDMIYNKYWLKNLYMEHKKYPRKIIANQARYITYDNNGKLLAYKKWNSIEKSCENNSLLLPIGAGGILYPINSLHEKVYDKKLFMLLAPKADDLWFKAMSLLKGTESFKSEVFTKEPIPILRSQKVSLKKINIIEDKNRVQWQVLSDYFNLKHKLVD
ncbi:hypothetical protein HME9304_00398 [Flagellimonas maritima]|uniref:Glycosyltransferase n=1 Tax=Flagellimonas maritima TaxID=1383885 RepID=A0A2Z4LNT1_9FLAO|nr:zinc-binding alcohol dehydrogenase [Allomuricauda aurantiaca]AWX43410.1 hypothetical protein HME9304_00398 [Allomuricauda aurantiaca]